MRRSLPQLTVRESCPSVNAGFTLLYGYSMIGILFLLPQALSVRLGCGETGERSMTSLFHYQRISCSLYKNV